MISFILGKSLQPLIEVRISVFIRCIIHRNLRKVFIEIDKLNDS